MEGESYLTFSSAVYQPLVFTMSLCYLPVPHHKIVYPHQQSRTVVIPTPVPTTRDHTYQNVERKTHIYQNLDMIKPHYKPICQDKTRTSTFRAFSTIAPHNLKQEPIALIVKPHSQPLQITTSTRFCCDINQEGKRRVDKRQKAGDMNKGLFKGWFSVMKHKVVAAKKS